MIHCNARSHRCKSRHKFATLLLPLIQQTLILLELQLQSITLLLCRDHITLGLLPQLPSPIDLALNQLFIVFESSFLLEVGLVLPRTGLVEWVLTQLCECHTLFALDNEQAIDKVSAHWGGPMCLWVAELTTASLLFNIFDAGTTEWVVTDKHLIQKGTQ